jgi:hypothetical protein
MAQPDPWQSSSSSSSESEAATDEDSEEMQPMIQQKPLVSSSYFLVHKNHATDLLTRAPCSTCGKRLNIDKTTANGHVLLVLSPFRFYLISHTNLSLD